MYQLIQNPTTLSLKEVAANFAQWRSTQGKKSKIPDILWEQVFALLGEYPKPRIWNTPVCKELFYF